MAITFEGSEKKLEIIIQSGEVSLREKPRSFWEAVVSMSEAQILSEIHTDECSAYLLSESSLFVWDSRIVMITCGTTTLEKAAGYILNEFGSKKIDALFYQRKNEYFPRMQKTDFTDDCSSLKNMISGRAFRLGDVDSHHMMLFHSTKSFQPKAPDTTLEVLMYDLRGFAKDVFIKKNKSAEFLRKESGLNRILPDFKVDDFAFKPYGYSLNALRGRDYYTFHVTPQKDSSYVSFETNVRETEDIQQSLNNVLEIFRPRSFDVVFFDSKGRNQLVDLEKYEMRSHVEHPMNLGYTMLFRNFTVKDPIVKKSIEIKF